MEKEGNFGRARMALDLAELYQAAVETAADAILVLDEGGRILFANSATSRLFRYAVPELIGSL